MTRTPNRRILLVDDMPSIHGDFRKIFRTQMQQHAQLGAMEAALFGKEKPAALEVSFELDSAYQGQEAWAMVQTSVAVGARTPWPLSTCACRPAGTACKP